MEEAARAVVAGMPDGMLEALSVPGDQQLEPSGGNGFAEAFLADFAPAQAAAIRRAIELLRERGR